MKFKTMTAFSVLALMLSLPDYATTAFARTAVGSAPTSVLGSVKSGLSKADEVMRDTADDIKAFFIGRDVESKVALEPVTIHRNLTAHGLLGKAVVNANGDRVATVEDIIINKNGKAAKIVVSDRGFLGIGGKVAAFDYNKVLAQHPDGKIVMTLTQDMIDHAANYSYEQKDWTQAKVIPMGSTSVNDLLAGDVWDNNGKKVADIDNVYIRTASASQIIAAFNKVLGMGGDLAALDYDDSQIIRTNKGIHFKLTPSQSIRFKDSKVSFAD
jgi:sporulation protein YlmC with PRC-barrel domain